METKSKIALAAAGLLAVILVLRALWLWQPERQVLLHQRHLLDAAQDKRWSRFASFIDSSYSDRWGHDKTFVVRETSEVLRQFFALQIEDDTLGCDLAHGRAEVRQKLKLAGNGTAIAEFANEHVNHLQQPFTFAWKRQSWKPWDWRLVGADHPTLRVESY